MKSGAAVESKVGNISVAGEKSLSAQRPAPVRRWLPYLAVTVCTILYLVPFMRLPVRGLDEGTLLYGAVRVLRGEVPFRDFFEVMGPGSFYWLALFFKILGTTWLVSRFSLTLAIVCSTLLVYFLTLRLRGRPSIIPAVFLLAVSFSPSWPAISHHVDSNLFALLAFTALILWLEKRRTALLLAAGAMAALTTCFLLPKGILLFVSFLIALVLLCPREASCLRSIVWLSIGYLAVTASAAVLFWRAGALGGLVYANFIWPIQRYGHVNTVPYGYGIQFYWNAWTESLGAALSPLAGYVVAGTLVIPFLILAALPLFLLLIAIRNRSVAFHAVTVPYWLAGSALWVSEIHRRDITHLAWGSPILVVLCFYICGRLRSKFYAPALQVVTVSAFVLAGFSCLAAQVTPAQRLMTRRGVIYSSGADPVLEFLNSHVQAGDSIFIYPYHPMYYYLAGVNNPTRYSILMYNMNTGDQFQETVRSLEKSRVRYVLWDTAFERERIRNVFPGYSAPPDQQLIIEPYLSERYRVVDDVGGFRIMERRLEQEQPRRFKR